MAAAAVVFFAYIGFDAVSTTAEEAKNPQARSADRHHRVAGGLHDPVSRRGRGAVRHRPGDAVPVGRRRAARRGDGRQAESIKFLNAPVAYALAFIGQDWAACLVSAGAVAGITRCCWSCS